MRYDHTYQLLLGLAAISCGCKEEPPVIRPEAVAEIAENARKGVEEEFLSAELKQAKISAAGYRRLLASSPGPNELALAAEDLRRANDKVARIEDQIRKLNE